MGIVYLNDSTLSDIADAIRYKENSQNYYYPNQMSMAIRNINSNGSTNVVDQSLILNLSSYGNYNISVQNFYVTNIMPDDAQNVTVCDIGDETLSKSAYVFEQNGGSTIGIYSAVNNVDNISIMSMANLFVGSNNLTTGIVSGSKTYDMSYAYNNCRNLKDTPKCSDSVKFFQQCYSRCENIIGTPICGNNVIDMHNSYYYCPNLTGSPACGINVKDMSYAYWSCLKLNGSPVCGNSVVNMASTYQFCRNLTGLPVCGSQVVNFAGAYYNCDNLTGSPVCGDNVEDMASTYYQCKNLTGSPVCGNNVTNMYAAYRDCINLTGNAVFSPILNNIDRAMTYIYMNCNNLTGINIPDTWTDMPNFAYGASWYTGTANCGKNVTSMDRSYYNCFNLVGNAVFGESMSNPRLDSYYYCNKLTGIEIRNDNANMAFSGSGCYWYRGNVYAPPNTTNMYSAYDGCYNAIGNPMCGEYVTNFADGYSSCFNITGSPVCGNNVVDMSNTYNRCYNLTGEAVCGDLVINFASAYNGCNNLTAIAPYHNNVIDMRWAYGYCVNLTGNIFMGEKVSYCEGAYYNCSKLTGTPVIPYLNNCNCSNTYYGCSNLTGSPANILGEVTTLNRYFRGCSAAYTYYNCCNLESSGDFSVFSGINNISYLFYNCPNIYGNIYLYYNQTAQTYANAYRCFYGRDNSRVLNIHVVNGGGMNSWIYSTRTITSGSAITWTTDDSNYCYYNTQENIYVYYDL